MRLTAAAVAILLLSAPAAGAGDVGVQRITVPDSDQKARAVALWYPVAGQGLPLVVILHGNQGVPENHRHTAVALAEAGFVAAAVGHETDMPILERARHVSRVIDHVLTAWPDGRRLDAARIGVYGFSVGGFTALVSVGGKPDLTRIGPYCAQHQDRVCAVLKDRNFDTPIPPSAWAHDVRVRAAVIAAPTLGFTFTPDGLAPITAPLQLWRPANDEITPHPRHAEAVYQALAVKPDYVVVPRAGHFAFVGCTPEVAQRAPAVCRDAPEFDREAFHRTFNGAVVAFLRTRLLAR